jgi:hypothetical protein
MRKVCYIIVFILFIHGALSAQVQSINIAGSYSGSFLLSSTSEPYQIAGTPYLSESWMYGTIEMKSELIDASASQSQKKLVEYERAIRKCDLLIEKITDPRFQTMGISFLMEEIDHAGEEGALEVEIFHQDFEDLQDITKELESKLLGYLTQLRAEYEAQIQEIQKVNGLFRYNLYAQEFEMVFDQDTFAIIAPFNVESITVSNKKFIHGFYVKRGLSQDYLGSSYFEVLNDGKCKLLLRHAVKIKSGDAPVTYNWANAGTDAFVKYQQLFYQQEEGSEILPLKKKKKILRKLFSEKYDEIMDYIRTEDLNVKRNDDLAQVFTYYNSLET